MSDIASIAGLGILLITIFVVIVVIFIYPIIWVLNKVYERWLLNWVLKKYKEKLCK